MAGVDEALMLDPHGFVATCNSVNFFCVRRGEVRMCENVCVGRREVKRCVCRGREEGGERATKCVSPLPFPSHWLLPPLPPQVWAPTTKYQLHGVTRANILQLCRDNGIPSRELDFSLTQVCGGRAYLAACVYRNGQEIYPIISHLNDP